jgi:hypothetical protein
MFDGVLKRGWWSRLRDRLLPLRSTSSSASEEANLAPLVEESREDGDSTDPVPKGRVSVSEWLGDQECGSFEHDLELAIRSSSSAGEVRAEEGYRDHQIVHRAETKEYVRQLGKRNGYEAGVAMPKAVADALGTVASDLILRKAMEVDARWNESCDRDSTTMPDAKPLLDQIKFLERKYALVFRSRTWLYSRETQ